MSERTTSELHFTAVNWLTGITSAAAGGGLLLLVEGKAEGCIAWGLAVAVMLFLLAFAFGTLVQLHAIAAMGFDEAGNAVKAEAARTHRNFFQYLMLCALYTAALVVAVGALFAAYSAKPANAPDAAAAWQVLASASDASADTVVVSDARTVVVLTRAAGNTGWTSTSYRRDPDAGEPAASMAPATAPAPDAMPLPAPPH